MDILLHLFLGRKIEVQKKVTLPKYILLVRDGLTFELRSFLTTAHGLSHTTLLVMDAG